MKTKPAPPTTATDTTKEGPKTGGREASPPPPPVTDEDIWTLCGRITPWYINAATSEESKSAVKPFWTAIVRWARAENAGDPTGPFREAAITTFAATASFADTLSLPRSLKKTKWTSVLVDLEHKRPSAFQDIEPLQGGLEPGQVGGADTVAKTLSSKTEDILSFTTACSRIRSRLDDLESRIVRDVLAIADLFAEAKAIYERETGTGHGKRNPGGIPKFADAAADEINRSPSFVEKYVQLAECDAEVRREIAKRPKLARTFTHLAAFVAEPDTEVRARALHAFDERGPKAFKEALSGSPAARAAAQDPALKRVFQEVLDPTTTMGGLPHTVTIPPALAATHEFLKSFETFGDLRKALKEQLPQQATKRPRSDAAFRDEHQLGVKAVSVGVLIGADAERVHSECGTTHTIKVSTVVVPWGVIEAAVDAHEQAKRDADQLSDFAVTIEPPPVVTITEGTAQIEFAALGRKVRQPKR